MATAFDPFYGEAWTRAQVESALLQGTCAYWLIAPNGTIARHGDDVAGFALVRRILDEAELLLFAVAPVWRRRGLGALLLARVQADLRGDGVAQMLLEMRRGNRAESLYRANGFTPIGMRPQYYRATNGDRIDAITFCCKLDEQQV